MRPKKTILCVDDNEQSLSIRKIMLETRGYRVVATTSGQEAVNIVSKGGIDLVLSDLVMPDFDGKQVVAGVKALSPATPTILFSGKIAGYDSEMPADIFLPKGTYAPSELLERIRLLLVRKRGPRKAVSELPELPREQRIIAAS